MVFSDAQIEAGQSVYNRRTLAAYDLVVLRISNSLIWRCPTSLQLANYQANVSDNHLDVGVGSGYFLDHCQFASPTPRLALMDLNENALRFAADRVQRYRPEFYQRNVLSEITFSERKFDSVGINYLLHCLPGTMSEKLVAFDNLRPLLNTGATLFGATIVGQEGKQSFLARKLMKFYNRKGIFCNFQDSQKTLAEGLHARFADVSCKKIGCVVLFSGRNEI